MQLLERLTQSAVLWALFIATILMTVAFAQLSISFDLTLIDGISAPELVRSAIAAMTEKQRVAHVWITGTLDVAYPIAYGLLFAGSALKFFPRAGLLLALPGLLAIPVDLLEGVVQILALTDRADLLSSKAVLTPVKNGLFLLGLLITVCGWLRWTWQVLVRRFGSNAA